MRANVQPGKVRQHRELLRLIGFALSAVCSLANGVEQPARPATQLIRLPASDLSPYLQKAELAARAECKDLFAGKLAATTNIVVDLDLDGGIYRISREYFSPGPLGEESYSKEQSKEEFEIVAQSAFIAPGAIGRKFLGWYGAKGNYGLYLSYRVLKWPIDQTRSVDRVNSAVREKFAEFYKPRPLELESDPSAVKVLTVLMRDDGSLDRSQIHEHPSSGGDADRLSIERFRELGLSPEQLTYRGYTSNHGTFGDKNLSAPLLSIEYAWQRRPGDPLDYSLRSRDMFREALRLQQAEQQRLTPDEEFAKYYFGDILEGSADGTALELWLLLNRQGEVIDTGRRPLDSNVFLVREIKSRFKGITVEGPAISSFKTKDGRLLQLIYLWIGADSPIKVANKR